MSGLENLLVIALLVVVGIMFRHHKKSEREYNEIVLLRDAAIDISNHMMDMENVDEGFQYILETCIRLIPDATLGSILMLGEDGYLTAHAHLGFSEDQIKDFRIPFKDSFVYHKTDGQINKVMVINDLKAMLKSADTVETDKEGMYIQSQLTAPLMDGQKLIGIVCIDSLKNHVFKENDRVFLEYMMKHINGITKQQYLRERVMYHARHDYLTGLYNRSYFDKQIEEALEDSTRNLILCEIDMDGLKLVNDIHGHLAGDKLIQVFSKGLKDMLSEEEFAGRYGGDEFMVCLYEKDIESAENRLKTLSSDSKKMVFMHDGEGLFPQFSYGMVKFPDEGNLLDVLLSKSDARMYKQKRNKKKHKNDKRLLNQ